MTVIIIITIIIIIKWIMPHIIATNYVKKRIIPAKNQCTYLTEDNTGDPVPLQSTCHVEPSVMGRKYLNREHADIFDKTERGHYWG